MIMLRLSIVHLFVRFYNLDTIQRIHWHKLFFSLKMLFYYLIIVDYKFIILLTGCHWFMFLFTFNRVELSTLTSDRIKQIWICTFHQMMAIFGHGWTVVVLATVDWVWFDHAWVGFTHIIHIIWKYWK
jgi:hypothetical protein